MGIPDSYTLGEHAYSRHNQTVVTPAPWMAQPADGGCPEKLKLSGNISDTQNLNAGIAKIVNNASGAVRGLLRTLGAIFASTALLFAWLFGPHSSILLVSMFDLKIIALACPPQLTFSKPQSGLLEERIITRSSTWNC